MKKIFKYLSYGLIYLLISLASAYGVITISINNAQKQSRGDNKFTGSQTETTIPAQLSSMVENFMQKEFIQLNLSASIDSNVDNFVINIETNLDLSDGFDNMLVEGNIKADVEQNNKQFDIDFGYQNQKAYFDLLNGKISVDANNVFASLTQILTLIDIQMPEIGFDMSELNLNTVLGMFSNLTEEELPDNENLVSLTIVVPMIDQNLILICDKDYNLQSLSFNYETDELKVNLDASLSYPSILEIEEKNPAEYVELGNLLNVIEGAIRYGKNYDKYAFTLKADYSNLNLIGDIYINPETQSIKLTANIEKQQISLIYLNEIIFVEYNNVFLKFNISDLNKVNELLNNAFSINFPIDKIVELINSIKDGKLSDSLGGFDISSLKDFDINTLDLSKLENVWTEGDETYIKVRNIGTFVFSLTNRELYKIGYLRQDLVATLEAIAYKDFSLASATENYINIVELFPTIENAVNIINSESICGNIKIKYGQITLPIDLILTNNYIKISTKIKDYNILIEKYNNKIYLNIADSLKVIINIDELSDIIIDFLSNIQYEIDLTELKALLSKLQDILKPEFTPLLIKSLIQTEKGFVITLFNDLSITLENGSKSIEISTTIEGFDVNVSLIGSDTAVSIPTFNDEEYTSVESLLDIAKVFINSGLLNVVEGAINYLSDGKLALNYLANYDKYCLSGDIYADVKAMKASMSINYQNEKINILLESNVVYFEFKNIFAKFALADLPQTLEMANNQFNLNLPIELINKIFGSVSSGKIEKVVETITNEFGSDFKLDLTKLDLTFFDKITVDGNRTTIPFGENEIVVTVEDKVLTGIEFTGFGANFTANTVEFKENTLAVEKDLYIDLAKFIPTIENAIKIVKQNTISGEVTVSKGEISLTLNYTISKASELYINFNTTIKNKLISISYLNGKVYFNADGKLMISSVVENLPEVIKQFIKEIKFEIKDEDFDKVVDTMLGVVNIQINPLLIKSLIQTEKGFVITLFNDLSVTLENGSKSIEIFTTIEGFDVNVSIAGSDTSITIPTFNDEEYTSVESLLDIAKAFINSGLLGVVEGAINYLSDGKLALNYLANYDKYCLSGDIYADIKAMKASISVNYKDEKINILLESNVVYLEYKNIFAKFALSDLPQTLEMANTQFNLNLPIELINKMFVSVSSGKIEEVVETITNEFGSDFKLDLTKLDLTFFDKITVEGNKTTIPFGENQIVVTVEDKVLSSIEFNGFDANFAANTVEFKENTLAVEKDMYIDLAKFIPTIENAIKIIKSNTISGNLNIQNSKINIPLEFKMSKNNKFYIEFVATINNGKLSIYYYEDKVYINFVDKIKVVADIKELPDQLKELSNGMDTLLKPILDIIGYTGKIQEMVTSNAKILFKSLIETENGFTLTFYNDINVTLTNSELTITLSDTDISGTIVNGNLSGSEDELQIKPLTADFNAESYSSISEFFKLINAAKNMSKRSAFHVKGTVHVSALSIVNLNLPIDIYIKVDENKRLELILEINVPYNFLAGIAAFDDFSGGTRNTKIYFKGEEIHIYRKDTNKNTEYFERLSINSFLSDPIKHVQFALGLKSSIADQIRNGIENPTKAHPDRAVDLNQIINTFNISNNENSSQTSFEMNLNLKEIADNTAFSDKFLLNFVVSETESGEYYIQKLSLDTSLVSVISLNTVADDHLQIVDYPFIDEDYEKLDDAGKVVKKAYDDKIQEMNDYIVKHNSTKYDTQYKATVGSDKWEIIDTTTQTITFISDNIEIGKLTGVYDTELENGLLSPSKEIFDDGEKVIIPTFAGWFTTKDFKEETKFTSNRMPHSLSLYAKWDYDTRYYRLLSFKTNCNTSFDNLKILSGENITDLSKYNLTTKRENIGGVDKIYTFGNWWLDDKFTKELSLPFAMPDQDITLYAKWNEVDPESTSILTIIDSGNAIYTTAILIGENINPYLENCGKFVEGKTKFYLNPDFSGNEYRESIMPKEDLTLYIRNPYKVNIISPDHGEGTTIDKNLFSQPVLQGSSISLPAPSVKVIIDPADEGKWKFEGFEINGQEISTTSDHSLIMPNTELNVKLIWRKYYTITYTIYYKNMANIITTNRNGTPESQEYLAGSNITISDFIPTVRDTLFIATYNYYKGSWYSSVDGVDEEIPTIINISKNYNVFAKWTKIDKNEYNSLTK